MNINKDSQGKIISIVTPSFNQANFISKTIESVLTQEGNFYIDYIILDGLSSDNSVEIIKNFEQLLKDNSKIKKINHLEYYIKNNEHFKLNQCLGISYRWLSKKDHGQSDAINQGFKLATGQVVAWLNSDDYYLNNALKITMDCFDKQKCDIVYGKAIAVDISGTTLWNYNLPNVNLYIFLNKKVTIPQPSIFFKRNLITKFGGLREDLHYCMDYELLVRFLFHNVKFAPINFNLSVQTYHQDSKSCSASEKFLIERATIINDYRKKFNIFQKLLIWKYRWIYKYYPYLLKLLKINNNKLK